jgi:hypothetical protein
MTGLLPHVLSHAVHSRTLAGASQSYGVIPLLLALILLVGFDVGRIGGMTVAQRRIVVAIAVPLLTVAGLTMAARFARVLP